PSTINRRILAARSFSSFIFQRFIDQATAEKQIAAELVLKRQESQFSRALFPKTALLISAKPYPSVDDETVQLLVDLLHPASDLNPYKSTLLKTRNFCIFLIILETG